MRILSLGCVLALAVSAFAQNNATSHVERIRQNMNDHSAFFNGAGYNEDVPVRVGASSRVFTNTNPDHRHRPPRHCAPVVRTYWVPGYYQWTTQRVWIEPTYTTEYVPPVYRSMVLNGNQIQVLVRDGFYRQVLVPGHFETRRVQVWVDGYWAFF